MRGRRGLRKEGEDTEKAKRKSQPFKHGVLGKETPPDTIGRETVSRTDACCEPCGTQRCNSGCAAKCQACE